ncbi:MAG: DUF4363 family protein [Clostridia bacterium]|nr:DUF4363 family protein [Clostridia bacterium]
MRSVRGALVALVVLIAAVLVNSIYIGKVSRELMDKIEQVEGEDAALLCDEYERIFEEFKKAERIISLTVSHDDLTNIEEGFAEIIGAARAGGEVGLSTVKSRLADALEHLGRLSGINIDSIF